MHRQQPEQRVGRQQPRRRGVVGGLNYNWCMTESQANAPYRGFNYPHQIASYYALYRVARNHARLSTRKDWRWYLARAANTTIRLGYANCKIYEAARPSDCPHAERYIARPSS